MALLRSQESGIQQTRAHSWPSSGNLSLTEIHGKPTIFCVTSIFLQSFVVLTSTDQNLADCGANQRSIVNRFTLRCYSKDLPHSKQRALNRDVINPQAGHILCDPYPAICGFRLRISWSRRIANSTIRRPKEMLIALISVVVVGNKGWVPWVNPHFYRLRKEAVGRIRYLSGSATEICGRDFLSLALCVSNSKLLGN